MANEMKEIFLEVIVAPSYEEKALALAYLRKHNLSNYYVLYKTALQKVLRGQITKESLGLVPVSDDAKLSKKIS